MSNDLKIEDEMVKIGKILDNLNFGSADSPRVRGRRSAVHRVCSQEALQRGFSAAKICSGRSSSHRCNRLAADTPVMCPLGKARTVRPRTADGPRLRRGGVGQT
jgi:hypothetical protein